MQLQECAHVVEVEGIGWPVGSLDVASVGSRGKVCSEAAMSLALTQAYQDIDVNFFNAIYSTRHCSETLFIRLGRYAWCSVA